MQMECGDDVGENDANHDRADVATPGDKRRSHCTLMARRRDFGKLKFHHFSWGVIRRNYVRETDRATDG